MIRRLVPAPGSVTVSVGDVTFCMLDEVRPASSDENTLAIADARPLGTVKLIGVPLGPGILAFPDIAKPPAYHRQVTIVSCGLNARPEASSRLGSGDATDISLSSKIFWDSWEMYRYGCCPADTQSPESSKLSAAPSASLETRGLSI